MILRTVERAGEAGLSGVNRCVGGAANVELAESVELNVDSVIW